MLLFFRVFLYGYGKSLRRVIYNAINPSTKAAFS